MIANHGHAASAQRRQMPTFQYAAFSTFPSPVHIGGDDVAMTDDDDSLFVQTGCAVSHSGVTFATGLLAGSYWRLKATISIATVREKANTSRSSGPSNSASS